ncbi:MAG TPA: hypothetical protein VH092_12845 [Urbifossiella sp.]|jgi:hypothetical protein|nr:hypothetical protein [Urbifossiella sp.]
MTREEATAIAERFVTDKALEVGPLEAVLFVDGSQYEEPKPPPHWNAYFKDLTPADDDRRAAWGDMPAIVMGDDATGRAGLFCYL